MLLTSVGSLAYAEDDNRHFLGIKTLRVEEEGEGGEEEDRGSYCCHMLECDNEVCILQPFIAAGIFQYGCLPAQEYFCRAMALRMDC